MMRRRFEISNMKKKKDKIVAVPSLEAVRK